jgi:hypothetical protein
VIRQKSLGALEQQVMEFLWEHGRATGEEVRAAVGKERPLTDSTIRTVPRRLEAKQEANSGTRLIQGRAPNSIAKLFRADGDVGANLVRVPELALNSAIT